MEGYIPPNNIFFSTGEKMRDGFKILDFDRHIKEPENLFELYLTNKEKSKYLPQKEKMAPENETFSKRLERLKEYACFDSPEQVIVNKEPLWADMSEKVTIELNLQSLKRRNDISAAGEASSQLNAMDETYIDVAILLPNHGSYYVNNEAIKANQSRAYAYAYNHWMADFMSESPNRLIGTALISRHDPELMIADLEHAINLGFRVVALQSSPVAGTTLESSKYHPFWRACEANNIAVVFHTYTHSRIPILGSDRFNSRFGKFSCAHPMEAMSGILSLMTGGILEKFPELHFGFLEAGIGWLPYWLWRLDELAYKSLKTEVSSNICRPPSEYFNRQIWVAIEPEEVMLPETIAQIGDSQILFGSDYPHMDHASENVDSVFGYESTLGRATIRKLLWENGLNFLGQDFRKKITDLEHNTATR